LSIFTCDNKDEFIFDMFAYSENSYFVDVGASDGLYGSNTFSLENRGWSGLCIEPHPNLFEELKKRSCDIDNCLVGDSKGVVEFALQKNESHIKGFSGDNIFGGYSHAWRGGSGILSNWKKKRANATNDYDIIKMETNTLTSVLDKHKSPQYIQLLDIDTEGNDCNVLKGIDWSKYRFACILIEKNSDEVKSILKENDYSMEIEFSEEYLYVDNKKEGLIENAKNIKNIGYWSQRIFGETCL